MKWTLAANAPYADDLDAKSVKGASDGSEVAKMAPISMPTAYAWLVSVAWMRGNARYASRTQEDTSYKTPMTNWECSSTSRTV
jgi:hypothetical protein